MPIPSANTQKPFVAPQHNLHWTEQNGKLTQHARQFVQQVHEFLAGTTRVISCSCTNVGNIYTLTIPPTGPSVTQYNDYDIYVFSASANSTGLVTGNVVTARGDHLATFKWFTSVSTQANAGDIVSGDIYLAIFAD